jgi:hypothetical protein
MLNIISIRDKNEYNCLVLCLGFSLVFDKTQL